MDVEPSSSSTLTRDALDALSPYSLGASDQAYYEQQLNEDNEPQTLVPSTLDHGCRHCIECRQAWLALAHANLVRAVDDMTEDGDLAEWLADVQACYYQVREAIGKVGAGAVRHADDPRNTWEAPAWCVRQRRTGEACSQQCHHAVAPTSPAQGRVAVPPHATAQGVCAGCRQADFATHYGTLVNLVDDMPVIPYRAQGWMEAMGSVLMWTDWSMKVLESSEVGVQVGPTDHRGRYRPLSPLTWCLRGDCERFGHA